MISDYEKEVYQFFTKPDNFETMLKVADHASEVTKKLIEDFWTELKEKIASTLKEEDNDWIVGFSDNMSYRWNKLWVYKRSWCGEESLPVISVGFEELQPKRLPYIGVHIWNDSKKYNSTVIKENVIALDEEENYDTDSNKYWAIWKTLSFNLWDIDSLKQLLPENREETYSILIKDVKDLLLLLGDQVPTILSNNKEG